MSASKNASFLYLNQNYQHDFLEHHKVVKRTKDFQTAYQGEIWCLFTVIFLDKLDSYNTTGLLVGMYLLYMYLLQYLCSLLEKEMICSSTIEIQFPMSFFCERTSKLQCRTIDMKQKYQILNEMVQWAIHIKYKCHVLSEISAFLCLRLLSIIMP